MMCQYLFISLEHLSITGVFDSRSGSPLWWLCAAHWGSFLGPTSRVTFLLLVNGDSERVQFHLCRLVSFPWFGSISLSDVGHQKIKLSSSGQSGLVSQFFPPSLRFHEVARIWGQRRAIIHGWWQTFLMSAFGSLDEMVYLLGQPWRPHAERQGIGQFSTFDLKYPIFLYVCNL